MYQEPRPSRELSESLFSDAAGFTMRALQPGRHAGGQRRVSHLALRRGAGFLVLQRWHRQQAGLSAGKGTRPKQTHILPHSCCGANRGGRGGLLFKSCCLSGDAFHLNGGLDRRCATLSLHTGQPLILLCRGFN